MTQKLATVDVPSTGSITTVLAVLGERVARAVEESRLTGDVPDDHRGTYFPYDLIIRDARLAPVEIEDVTLRATDIPAALSSWADRVGLSDRELSVVILAASPALDPRFEHFFIVLNNESETRGPSITTALRLIGADPSDPSNRALFDADSRLCALGILQVRRENQPFPSRTLHVSERVVRYLLGDSRFAPEVAGYLSRVSTPDVPMELLPTEPALPAVTVFGQTPTTFPVVRAHPGSGALSRVIAELTAQAGEVLLLNGALLPSDSNERRSCVAAAFTEATLAGLPLLIDDRAVSAEKASEDVASSHQFQVPAMVLTAGKVVLADVRCEVVELPSAPEQQRSQWWTTLGADAPPRGLKDLLQRLEPEEIRARIERRDQSPQQPRMSGTYARLTQPEFLLDDVILPAHVRAELDHLLDRVRLRSTVIDEWGMRPGGLRGRGITALLAGESGTGKTMAAEALAGELGTPLFHVNLASVVDKYIGETEKNLEKVFAEAENLDGVLLFDEADAVFGKRSDVSDARDRYANLEVAYLLQRIEAFDGLAILTTNLRSNLDPAFARRLDAILDFPPPDATLRVAIWRACLEEAGAIVSDDQLRSLATLNFAGGAIRSSAVSAAFMAANAGEPLSYIHAVRGARREWMKLGLLAFPLESVIEAAAAPEKAAPATKKKGG
jgi:hypothetical protein